METPRKFIIAKLSIRNLGSSSVALFALMKIPGYRLKALQFINLRGVFTNLNWTFSTFELLQSVRLVLVWLDGIKLYVGVKYREGGINPSFSVFNSNLFYFWGGFLVESFDFKQFKSKFVEIFPQVWSNYLFKGCIWHAARGTSKKTDTKIK